MKDIFIVGEDDVTKEIIRVLVSKYAPNLRIKRAEPLRGSQLKGMIGAYNNLSESIPVVLLEDLDTEDCAPSAKKKLLNGLTQKEDFIVNIAVDEAEAWLYADAEGLASYLRVPIESIPQAKPMRMGGPRARMEVDTNQKTSMHLTKELIFHSTDSTLIKQIASSDGRCKGKEYNPAILPFIQNMWNPENARLRSYSLDSSIKRIVRLNEKYAGVID